MQLCHILEKPTAQLDSYFRKHPRLFKGVLLVDHLFRAAAMVGFMFIPHIPKPVSWSLCVLGSLYYRLTVEKNCAYKFALPALAGAASFMLLLPTILKIMNQTAFLTVGSGTLASLSFIPILVYAGYIVVTVSQEVDANFNKSNCCA